MGINLIIGKKSLDLLAVDTSRPKPPVRMPRVPASHISGGALPCPYSTTLKHLKKTKKSLYVRERGQPQSSAPCTLEPVSQPTPSSKKYPKIEKNFSRYLTLTCKIQKKKIFSKIKPQPPKKKKKKKKKKK